MAFVVFAGQSNTGGYGQSASTLPQAWTPDPNIKIWDASQKAWATYDPGVNSGYAGYTSGWGPEMAFALAFRQEHPGETLYMVKHAEGGTGLAVDPAQWAYDWSPTSENELFDRVTAMIQDASASLGGLKPEALFWGQGEEDANAQADAQAYGQNLSAFLAAARAEWLGDPNGKVAFFQISGYAPFIGEVRQNQATVDAQDPNAWSFDPAGYPMQNDSVHYAAEGYRLLGSEFYRLYDSWQGGGGGGDGQQLNGTATADTLMGGVGDDSIAGGAGLDYLRGGEGDDLISGGDDFDDAHGNQGNDTVAGGFGDDWVVGGKDQDRLFGDEGADIVYGNLGDDYCDGGAENDLVRGGQGNDIVIGGAGDDWLSGDRGDDTVTGGSGADVFHSFGDAGLDRVTDFSRGEGDRIQLDPGTTWQVSQQGADTVIALSGGGRVVLVGVDSATLTGDWIFTL